ncbi:unnamed protein product [Dicrocoelium dendriticum]|nr:unnamed protein product [Dicrocoelium dendriticum]
MHSCLTLVDYTCREGEDSDLASPTGCAKETAMRWRRITRSLDVHASDQSSLREDRTAMLLRTNRSFRTNLGRSSEGTVTETSRPRQDSVLLLSSRQRPTYMVSRRLSRGPSRIWAPVGHCRYLLDRDPRTGEIQWSPESNEVFCSPRTLTEICLARLVRDWPCMLPPRKPSLRNVVSFLFSARESRSDTASSHARSGILNGRRAASMASGANHDSDDQNRCPSSATHKNGYASESHGSILPMTYHDLPINLLSDLLTEAILQRDCAAIAGLVANWPNEQLAIRRLIPQEEFPLSPNYLTNPSFVLVSPENRRGNRTTLVKGPSLLDAFILGLLSRQPVCKLTSLDFTGFEEDLRVSIELSRLPILWMKPESRNSEYVRRHLMASLHIGIPKKRLETYFSRIAAIYAIYESELGHGEPFGEFCPDYFLSITQFEMEDPSLGSSLAVVLPSAVGWLISLRNLRACSLPACIPPPPDLTSVPPSRTSTNFFPPVQDAPGIPQRRSNRFQSSSSSSAHTSSTPVFASNTAACRLLNRALISLRYLQRLGLARCHLTGQLKTLLSGLSQPLEYLNLQDCCLAPEDVGFLVHHWRPLHGLYELNLSRNNLSKVPDETFVHLVDTVCKRPPGQLVCLSIAYTCMSTDRLTWLVGLMAGMVNGSQDTEDNVAEEEDKSDKMIYATSTLRVLCIQTFVPPTRDVIHRILYRVARLPKLQRLHLFPAAYAFPGDGEPNQRELRTQFISHSRNYLTQRFRPDIEVL